MRMVEWLNELPQMQTANWTDEETLLQAVATQDMDLKFPWSQQASASTVETALCRAAGLCNYTLPVASWKGTLLPIT